MSQSLREDQIKAVDELIKSASDYVTNGHLINREQIVFLCNREVEKRIDSRIEYLTHTKERMKINGYVASVLDALQSQIDEGNKIKEMLKWNLLEMK